MICKATTDDVRVLAEFASALWPERSAGEIEEIFTRQLTGDSDSAFFICYHEGGPIGFALCQLRHDYVEGTTTSPVGYLEGIYVRKEFRRHNHGKELPEAGQKAARLNGCNEFATDCENFNARSVRSPHDSCSTDANPICCFPKKLLATPETCLDCETPPKFAGRFIVC